MRRLPSKLCTVMFSFALIASHSASAEAVHRSKQLPHPFGKYGVARIGYAWMDKARPEKYAEDSTVRREIMVYLWYPTKRGLGSSTISDYLPYADAISKSTKGMSRSDIEESWGSSWRSVFSNQVLTDTHERTPIADGTESFPLLIFSPGFGIPSFFYTTLIQDIVSRGYVIASIEPTYDVSAVAFPNGRVVPFRSQWSPGSGPTPVGETWQEFLKRLRAFGTSHVDTWAADIQFVMDQVTALVENGKKAAPFAGRVDLNAVGAWGHSIGGTAAARACQLDTRIKACLNGDGAGQDGPISVYKGANLPSQPFMWIDIYHQPATAEQLAVHKMTRKQWEKDHQARVAEIEQRLQACPGGSYHLTIKIAGTDHYSFTDWPLLDAQNEPDFDRATRALERIDAYTAAFFDKYLKHQDVALLRKPNTPSYGITLERYGKAR